MKSKIGICGLCRKRKRVWYVMGREWRCASCDDKTNQKIQPKQPESYVREMCVCSKCGTKHVKHKDKT